jgi:hypothetical protein
MGDQGPTEPPIDARKPQRIPREPVPAEAGFLSEAVAPAAWAGELLGSEAVLLSSGSIWRPRGSRTNARATPCSAPFTPLCIPPSRDLQGAVPRRASFWSVPQAALPLRLARLSVRHTSHVRLITAFRSSDVPAHNGSRMSVVAITMQTREWPRLEPHRAARAARPFSRRAPQPARHATIRLEPRVPRPSFTVSSDIMPELWQGIPPILFSRPPATASMELAKEQKAVVKPYQGRRQERLGPAIRWTERLLIPRLARKPSGLSVLPHPEIHRLLAVTERVPEPTCAPFPARGGFLKELVSPAVRAAERAGYVAAWLRWGTLRAPTGIRTNAPPAPHPASVPRPPFAAGFQAIHPSVHADNGEPVRAAMTQSFPWPRALDRYTAGEARPPWKRSPRLCRCATIRLEPKAPKLHVLHFSDVVSQSWQWIPPAVCRAPIIDLPLAGPKPVNASALGSLEVQRSQSIRDLGGDALWPNRFSWPGCQS